MAYFRQCSWNGSARSRLSADSGHRRKPARWLSSSRNVQTSHDDHLPSSRRVDELQNCIVDLQQGASSGKVELCTLNDEDAFHTHVARSRLRPTFAAPRGRGALVKNKAHKTEGLAARFEPRLVWTSQRTWNPTLHNLQGLAKYRCCARLEMHRVRREQLFSAEEGLLDSRL